MLLNKRIRMIWRLMNAVISAPAQTYSGSGLTPTPTVTINGVTIPSSNYNVTYSNNINAGTGNITISGKKQYIGNTTGTFTINKATPTYTAPTAKTNLKYNGSNQALLNAGSTSHGTFQYALGSVGTDTTTNYSYTGAKQTVTLDAGTYKLQCWGASGGQGPTGGGEAATYNGYGLGGYSEGTLTLSTSTTVYIYVGGQGASVTGKQATGFAGGFNGGGNGGGLGSTSSATNGSGGGGASDIRIGQDSLYARVIVAGGGGGASWLNNASSARYGGAGGGTSGASASAGSTGSTIPATGGTQTSGGTGGIYSSNTRGENGSFGQGGNGVANTSAIINSGAGGGGGWYGGGAGGCVNSGNQAHGAGGSGYVYTSSTVSNYPSGCLLNSNYYLTDAQTIAGNASMPSTSGSTETGHDGNGYVKITNIAPIGVPTTGWTTAVTTQNAPNTYYMYWKLVGDSNHTDVTASSPIPVTIAKGTGSATVTGRSVSYNRSAQNLVTVSGATGTVHYRLGTSGSWTTTIPTSTNAGTYTVYYYVAETTNYTAYGSSSSPKSVTTTISKITPVLSTSPSLRTGLIYTGSAQNLLSGGAMKHSSSDSTAVAGTFTYTQQINPGTYSNPTWSFTPSSTTNYNSTSGTITGNVTIAKITRTISFDNLQYIVEPNSTIQLSATPSADPSGGTITYSVVSGTVNINSSTGLVTTNSWEGTCTIQASISASTYYSSATTTCTLTVVTTTHNYSWTGSSQSITLIPGTYKLQCWGASGGNANTNNNGYGGKGGYSVGIITISTNTTAYIYVGGVGSEVTTMGNTVSGGFNGGGACRIGNNSYPCGSGGGASDIRIGQDSLYSRVIVAGGGGGGGYNSYGGSGGGTSGARGYNSGGQPGTQTAAGTANRNSNATAASFGQGGGSNGTATSSYNISGGGGGWYGGAHHSATTTNTRGAGGGSGYVYTSSTASNYPSGCTLNSSYYLSSASTTAGNTSFESTSGSTETGHSGDGYVRITMIEVTNISGATVTGTSKTYTGSALTTTVTVTLNGTTIPSSGYDIGYSNNINAGTATITVTGKGEYVGTATGTFTIKKATPTYTAPTGKNLLYTGSAQQLLNAGSTSHGTIYYYMAEAANNLTITKISSPSSIGDGATGNITFTTNGAATITLVTTSGTGWSAQVTSSANSTSHTVQVTNLSSVSTSGSIAANAIKVTAVPTNTSSYNPITTATGINNAITLSAATQTVTNYSYTGAKQTVTLTAGTYKLQCWGASGGEGTNNDSVVTTNLRGKGGYSEGILTLTSSITVYIYVGGQGTNSSGTNSARSGGFNGGGKCQSSGHTGSGGGSGGGASDIRIGQNSLYARVIVAGGGGGAGRNTAGGSGGGETGIAGIGTSTSDANASGGTQTSGGTCTGSYGGINGSSGSFGAGGSGGYSSGKAIGGGGGGGWYGGAGGKSGSNNVCKPGGGGSGYVYTSSTVSNYPSGCKLNSNYYLTSAQTIAGNASMPSTSGSTETGHTGNGYVKITKL